MGLMNIIGNIDIVNIIMYSGIAILFLLVIIIFYLIWRKLSRVIKAEKRIVDGKSIVKVECLVPIKKLILMDKVGEEEIEMVREDIKNGEKLEFVYPVSNENAVLKTEGDIKIEMKLKPKH
ncbi:hypothetical protein KAW38_03125 [Candidatus Micrarchaeota archaeon]|nr:hypothetical protein [Candidatus Micrarchaeota archaeon]